MQTNPLRAVDDQADAIYRVLKGRISLDSLIPTCLEVAREVENLIGVKGPEKLRILQSVLRQAVQDSSKSEEEKETILRVVDTVVPIAVQAAILASKSPIVAQVQTACVGCWTKTKRS
jgi:hypothetical protein